ncbi:MAG: hypothetical protein ACRCSB_00795 [Bacteroidales bacterium]
MLHYSQTLFTHIIMATFGSFTFDVVEKKFNINEVKTLPRLTEWLSSQHQKGDKIDFFLDDLKNHLLDKANIWNEDELKMFFIGPLIEASKIGTKQFQPFTQRFLHAVINGEEISGRVDFMVATGRRLPEQPYFCIHEYKQETDKEGDPLGQVLIAMVAAQALNEKKFPILGAYVIGRFWFFVVLDGQEYAKSAAFDAASEAIFQLFAILQKSKEIIQGYV